MLSIVDIKRELGKNIYIYPLHTESIKSNSIDLHASEYAWSLKQKKQIRQDNYIVIPPNDTALIYTEESIYVSNKIGGSCHSKVTFVSKGIGHIGTALDAQYRGNLLVALHNHSDLSFKLEIGSEFATLHFWYLNSPDYPDNISHDNEPGHPRMLSGFEGLDEYIAWRDKNTWTTRRNELYTKMTCSSEYKKCKENYQKELESFNRQFLGNRRKKYIKILLLVLGIILCFSAPAYFLDFGILSTYSSIMFEKIIIPLVTTVITTFIIIDIKDNKKE